MVRKISGFYAFFDFVYFENIPTKNSSLTKYRILNKMSMKSMMMFVSNGKYFTGYIFGAVLGSSDLSSSALWKTQLIFIVLYSRVTRRVCIIISSIPGLTSPLSSERRELSYQREVGSCCRRLEDRKKETSTRRRFWWNGRDCHPDCDFSEKNG